jgi:hypothetical protein
LALSYPNQPPNPIKIKAINFIYKGKQIKYGIGNNTHINNLPINNTKKTKPLILFNIIFASSFKKFIVK